MKSAYTPSGSLTTAGYQSWMSSSSPSPILEKLSTSEMLWDVALERRQGHFQQALRHQAGRTLQKCTARQERQLAPPRPCPGFQPPLWLKPRSTQSAWAVPPSLQVSCSPAPAMLQCLAPTCGDLFTKNTKPALPASGKSSSRASYAREHTLSGVQDQAAGLDP